MFVSAFVLCFLCLFNSAEIKSANPLYCALMFAAAEALGMVCGGRLLSTLSDTTSLRILFPLVAMFSVIVKMDWQVVYVTYLALFI